jgi:hypothetical protein
MTGHVHTFPAPEGWGDIRRMLRDEARALRQALTEPRPAWLPVVEWAQDRAAIRARLREIEEELAL